MTLVATARFVGTLVVVALLDVASRSPWIALLNEMRGAPRGDTRS